MSGVSTFWQNVFSFHPNALHIFSQKVALAMEAVIPCHRVGQAVIGLEVPHAHVHLIPLNAVSDINFERPKMNVSHDKLADTAQLLRGAYAAL